MAVLSTVGPAKDFATLQAWYDARLFDSDDQLVECYSGADLGSLDTSDYFNANTLIYAATSNKHNGQDAGLSGVAYTTGNLTFVPTGPIPSDHWEIRHLRLEGSVVVSVNGVDGFELDLSENLMVPVDGGAIAMIADDTGGSGNTFTSVCRNNVVYFKPAGTATPVLFTTLNLDVSAVTMNVKWQNNTIVRSAGTMTNGIKFDAQGETINATVQNNIVLGATAGDYKTGSATVNYTADHNLSSDATGDDWGAVGAKINQTPASVVVNVSTNATPKNPGPAINAGATLVGFAVDIIGTVRPQGAAWDMGCFEVVGPISSGRRRHHVLRFWRN